jgi:hypothetical protein
MALVARRYFPRAWIPCDGPKGQTGNVSVPSSNPCNLCNLWLKFSGSYGVTAVSPCESLLGRPGQEECRQKKLERKQRPVRHA